MVLTRSMPLHAAGAFVLAALLVLAFQGTAWADSEPNDNIIQAEGPLVSAKVYTGSAQTENDVDYYYLYAAPQTQLKLNFTAVACRKDVTVYDANGVNASGLPESSVYSDSPEVLSYTTPPAVTRLFISVTSSSCADRSYSFQLDANQPLTVGPSLAGAIVPIPEPNESIPQAFGPITGGQYYFAATDTSNDVDWAYFYTAAGTQQIDISLINVSANCGRFSTMLTREGSDVESKTAYSGQVIHYNLTSQASARYELGLTEGCTDYLGQGLQWRVDPASAVSPVLIAPPPEPTRSTTTRPRVSFACRQARAATSRAAKRYSAAKRRMNRARSTRTYNRARRQVKLRRSALRKARSRQARAC